MIIGKDQRRVVREDVEYMGRLVTQSCTHKHTHHTHTRAHTHTQTHTWSYRRLFMI